VPLCQLWEKFILQQDISPTYYFSEINISQGSVATSLRWVAIFNDGFIANFLQSAGRLRI